LYLSYKFFSYDRHDRYNDMESKHDVDGSKNVVLKFNFTFLQSFFNYSKSLWLKNVSCTILELNWNQRLGHRKATLNINFVIIIFMLTSSTQLQNRSFCVVERTRMHVQSVQNYYFSLSNNYAKL